MKEKTKTKIKTNDEIGDQSRSKIKENRIPITTAYNGVGAGSGKKLPYEKPKDMVICGGNDYCSLDTDVSGGAGDVYSRQGKDVRANVRDPLHQPLIPSLPDDVALFVMTKTSHGHHDILEAVCMRWRDALRSLDYERLRAKEGFSGIGCLYSLKITTTNGSHMTQRTIDVIHCRGIHIFNLDGCTLGLVVYVLTILYLSLEVFIHHGIEDIFRRQLVTYGSSISLRGSGVEQRR
ncbi:hypothetical protein GIB67_035519 [Kingdonia uniflora]|uniref:Uncharacterized protein n=1 Tax=Kingdonia uniflora TaxID=39325 RepID=A0A7J7MC41_9MAGN|nr:hypothetical protein GIB67_035519 [Kingdonia uniflora]